MARHEESVDRGTVDRGTTARGETYADGDTAYVDREDSAREKFGGANLGACFFGWLVAIAVAILLTSIIGAVVAAVGSNRQVTQSEAQRVAGTIGTVAAVVLLVVLIVAYYAGGYVAGRMSRFDGARQGVVVWVIGLLVTIIALALGAIFGAKYNILDRVNLPRIPVATDQLSWGAVITGVLVLVLTLLAAMLGGTVGHRYHNRVDRLVGRRGAAPDL
jgi:amino acid transporter